MNGSALLFMAFSWGLILSLTTFCFTRLFSAERRKKEGGKHGQART
ncbi:MAG: hypothetical protein K6360_04500 [Deltaproteobacteria bacterium]